MLLVYNIEWFKQWK